MTDKHLQKLRQEMKKKKEDYYVIPLSDFHQSEYVGDHFKEIEYISGFTGTNATLVVSQDEAGLWTDGRYFIQARLEMEGSGVKLFEMGEEGVPTVEEYLRKHLKKGDVLGYDGRMFSLAQDRKFNKIAEDSKAKTATKANLVDNIWEDRPALPKKPVWVLKDQYAGVTVDEKLKNLRKVMTDNGADAHLLTSLYDIAWLLNMRGDDIHCVPVFMSYFYLTEKKAVLYVDPVSVDYEAEAYLKRAHVELKQYDDVYTDLSKEKMTAIMVDPHIVNAELIKALPKGVKLVEKRNPTELMKAVKNETEIKNTREAHINDGVAMTKFIYWLKHTIGKEEITEISAADKLEGFRREQKDFLDISFDTIAGYKANAALMHYTATEDNYAVLKPEGFLLVDSGGHYLGGTTDITRTIALGPLTDHEKEAFTLTLRSHLRLLTAHFPYGTCGANLDILARGPMWDKGLDYRCGTGHGVGHILNVHEGPNTFRWRTNDPLNNESLTVLEPGMITTDEPGLYEEGEFGIRIESELLCVEDEKTEYGRFLKFDVLTYCPIERDAIIPEMLTQYEKQAFNAYQSDVYETIAPRLTEDEAKWLKEVTRPL